MSRTLRRLTSHLKESCEGVLKRVHVILESTCEIENHISELSAPDPSNGTADKLDLDIGGTSGKTGPSKWEIVVSSRHDLLGELPQTCSKYRRVRQEPLTSEFGLRR